MRAFNYNTEYCLANITFFVDFLWVFMLYAKLHITVSKNKYCDSHSIILSPKEPNLPVGFGFLAELVTGNMLSLTIST